MLWWTLKLNFSQEKLSRCSLMLVLAMMGISSPEMVPAESDRNKEKNTLEPSMKTDYDKGRGHNGYAIEQNLFSPCWQSFNHQQGYLLAVSAVSAALRKGTHFGNLKALKVEPNKHRRTRTGSSPQFSDLKALYVNLARQLVISRFQPFHHTHPSCQHPTASILTPSWDFTGFHNQSALF